MLNEEPIDLGLNEENTDVKGSNVDNPTNDVLDKENELQNINVILNQGRNIAGQSQYLQRPL